MLCLASLLLFSLFNFNPPVSFWSPYLPSLSVRGLLNSSSSPAPQWYRSGAVRALVGEKPQRMRPGWAGGETSGGCPASSLAFTVPSLTGGITGHTYRHLRSFLPLVLGLLSGLHCGREHLGCRAGRSPDNPTRVFRGEELGSAAFFKTSSPSC